MNLNDWTISDWETAVIAFSSLMSLIIIWRQSISMGEQTRIATEQKRSSDELIKIELNRDQQANLVSAWVSAEPRSSGDAAFILGLVYFMNASTLPVYEFSYKLVYYKEGVVRETTLPKPLGNEKNVIRVIPPSKEPRLIFELEGLRDGTGERIRSRDLLSKEKNYTNFVTLSESGICEQEFLTLAIEISFTTSDGSNWVRTSWGGLYNPPILF